MLAFKSTEFYSKLLFVHILLKYFERNFNYPRVFLGRGGTARGRGTFKINMVYLKNRAFLSADRSKAELLNSKTGQTTAQPIP